MSEVDVLPVAWRVAARTLCVLRVVPAWIGTLGAWAGVSHRMFGLMACYGAPHDEKRKRNMRG